MELTNKQKDLIKKALVKSKLYQTRSLEQDELIALVAKKASLFLSTLTDDTILEKFLDKTAEAVLSKHQKDTSFAKAEPQVANSSSQNNSYEEDIFKIEYTFETEDKEPELELYTEEKISFDIKHEELPTLNPEKLYEHVQDPKITNKTKKVPADVANKILDILTEASTVYETKDYIKIFYLKYIKKLKQAQIAKKLHISEMELSQKYFEMVKYVKEKLYS